MRKITSYGLLVTGYAIMLALILGGCAKKQNVLATVGDEVITKAAFDERIGKLPAPYQKMAQANKAAFLDEMVLEMLFVNEAKKRGLRNDKEVQDLLKEAERKILIAKLVDDETKKITNVSDEEMLSFYEAHKNEFAMPESYRASHIMVETQKEAEDILAKLKGGVAFEELARTASKDEPSKGKGGDIGPFTKGNLLPEFEDVAIALNVGELSGVVKSPIGYHIIKLTDKQDARIASFEEMKQKIETELLNQKRRETVEGLAKKLKDAVKIKIDEKLLDEK